MYPKFTELDIRVQLLEKLLYVVKRELFSYVHDITVFTNLCICSLQRDDNGIVFKNLHFETSVLKSLCIQALKMQLSCKWTLCTGS